MTDTFGRRLEAAAQDEYHRQCNIDDSSVHAIVADVFRSIISAANAQDSAPAPKDVAASNAERLPAGAGVDLADAVGWLRDMNSEGVGRGVIRRLTVVFAHIDAQQAELVRLRAERKRSAADAAAYRRLQVPGYIESTLLHHLPFERADRPDYGHVTRTIRQWLKDANTRTCKHGNYLAECEACDLADATAVHDGTALSHRPPASGSEGEST